MPSRWCALPLLGIDVMQGSHLAGEGGVGVERAPETLLEGITTFLMQQRASLRAETQIVLADRVSSLNTGKS